MRRLRQERLPRYAANGICPLVCVRIQPQRSYAEDERSFVHPSALCNGAVGASPIRSKALKQIPKTSDPLVIRTDFENQQAWKTICKLIREPVQVPGDTFYAHVEFLEDAGFRGLGEKDLLSRVPSDYNHSFLFVVDRTTISHPDLTILVIDLYEDRGRTFRAIPTAVQNIENNLSIANMDFFEFAEEVDKDGIFRGFPKH
jgi:hypothetical protein